MGVSARRQTTGEGEALRKIRLTCLSPTGLGDRKGGGEESNEAASRRSREGTVRGGTTERSLQTKVEFE